LSGFTVIKISSVTIRDRVSKLQMADALYYKANEGCKWK
jgi:hypothetical protein